MGPFVATEGIDAIATSYGLASSLHVAYETGSRDGISISLARDSSKKGVRIVTLGRDEASDEIIKRSGRSVNFQDERFA